VADSSARQSVGALFSAAGSGLGSAGSVLGSLHSSSDWCCRPIGERFWFKYVAIGDELLSVRRLQIHGWVGGTTTTGSDRVVQWLEHGRARIDIGPNEVQMLPGTPPTMLPSVRSFPIEYEDLDVRLVHLGVDLLNDVAPEGRLATSTMALGPKVLSDRAAVAQWRVTVGQAMASFRADGPASASWRNARRAVALSLLACAPPQKQAALSSSIRTRRVAFGVAYVHAHAQEPLTVADVAEAAGLSVRGIQEAFQRELQQSPTEFVREVRLARARAELQALTPGVASIASVARKWGFRHMGRFSAAYMEQFGEYPRQTLRQTRSAL
jgi:AraC-like DNA-binding protein